MFPNKEKKAAMMRMEQINEIVRKSNMNDPEIEALCSEYHDLAKAYDLYDWGVKELR